MSASVPMGHRGRVSQERAVAARDGELVVEELRQDTLSDRLRPVRRLNRPNAR
jgi:hypothetical protein